MSRLLLTYKILAHSTVTSNAGVGNTALHITRYLRREGYAVYANGTTGGADLAKQLRAAEAKGKPFNFVVISAFWMQTSHLADLVQEFPDTQFFVHSHSNDGFFQPDSLGCELLRQAIDLQRLVANLTISGNSKRFCESTSDTYAVPCYYLPNLFFIDRIKPERPLWTGGLIKVGIFGANRPQKNQANAVKAAILMARQMNRDVEIYMNSDARNPKNSVPRTSKAWAWNVPGVKIIEVGWQTYPEFRRTVSHMDLLISPSYTESFCNVIGDAIAERTPCVVSDAMDWTPKYWRAETDDVNDIAQVGRCLLYDPRAQRDGMKALNDHNTLAMVEWKRLLAPTSITLTDEQSLTLSA